MSDTAQRSERYVTEQILRYLRDAVLHGDTDNELDASTPLLEYGILNSIRTAELMTFISDELGYDSAFAAGDPIALRDVESLARTIVNGASTVRSPT